MGARTLKYQERQMTARAALHKALWRKELSRPDVCDLCGKQTNKIVGHHWRGYDFPLEVWWICHSCNHKIEGCHEGLLSKEDAMQIVSLPPFIAKSAAVRLQRLRRRQNRGI